MKRRRYCPVCYWKWETEILVEHDEDTYTPSHTNENPGVGEMDEPCEGIGEIGLITRPLKRKR